MVEALQSILENNISASGQWGKGHSLNCCLAHFSPIFHFYTPWKHKKKTKVSWHFCGGIEMEHWAKMGERK